jgi:hypothetical protein
MMEKIMKKLDTDSPEPRSADIVPGNIEALKARFPEALTEGRIDLPESRSEAGVVTVHHFRVWDYRRDKYVNQPLKTTAERIRQVKGEIIPGTAEDVAASALDPEGRYDPQHPIGGQL